MQNGGNVVIAGGKVDIYSKNYDGINVEKNVDIYSGGLSAEGSWIDLIGEKLTIHMDLPKTHSSKPNEVGSIWKAAATK